MKNCFNWRTDASVAFKLSRRAAQRKKTNSKETESVKIKRAPKVESTYTYTYIEVLFKGQKPKADSPLSIHLLAVYSKADRSAFIRNRVTLGETYTGSKVYPLLRAQLPRNRTYTSVFFVLPRVHVRPYARKCKRGKETVNEPFPEFLLFPLPLVSCFQRNVCPSSTCHSCKLYHNNRRVKRVRTWRKRDPWHEGVTVLHMQEPSNCHGVLTVRVDHCDTPQMHCRFTAHLAFQFEIRIEVYTLSRCVHIRWSGCCAWPHGTLDVVFLLD